MKPFTPNRTVTDTLHDLMRAADALRDMRLEAEVTVAEIEARWNKNSLANRCATAAFVPSASSPTVSTIRLQSTFAGEE